MAWLESLNKKVSKSFDTLIQSETKSKVFKQFKGIGRGGRGFDAKLVFDIFTKHCNLQIVKKVSITIKMCSNVSKKASYASFSEISKTAS